jgi:hypothetical protein
VVCFLVGHSKAQDVRLSKPIVIGADQGIDGRNCDTTKANFDLIAQTAGSEGTIIVIGHLGRGELSRELVRRRLRNLREFIYLTRGVSKERTVAAEGERVRGRGEVDVYVNGKLFMVFRMKRNRDFLTNWNVILKRGQACDFAILPAQASYDRPC